MPLSVLAIVGALSVVRIFFVALAFEEARVAGLSVGLGISSGCVILLILFFGECLGRGLVEGPGVGGLNNKESSGTIEGPVTCKESSVRRGIFFPFRFGGPILTAGGISSVGPSSSASSSIPTYFNFPFPFRSSDFFLLLLTP